MKTLKIGRTYNHVELNGVTFQLNKKHPIPYEHNLGGYRDIYSAYGRPSQTKIAIWEDWDSWFRENGGYCKITSMNCNFFSITGFVTDKETNKRYMAYITYANHYLYEVEG